MFSNLSGGNIWWYMYQYNDNNIQSNNSSLWQVSAVCNNKLYWHKWSWSCYYIALLNKLNACIHSSLKNILFYICCFFFFFTFFKHIIDLTFVLNIFFHLILLRKKTNNNNNNCKTNHVFQKWRLYQTNSRQQLCFEGNIMQTALWIIIWQVTKINKNISLTMCLFATHWPLVVTIALVSFLHGYI